ncbi:MAG: AsnC family protein, partial [Candidatus Bathyarchaeota archaeon]
YYWIKKSYGQDIYHFMNTNLWTVSAQSYQAAMRFVTAMPRDQVLIFDGDGNYDKMRWPDIPRVKPRHRIKGEITLEEDEGKKKQYDGIDLLILTLRGRDPPMSYTAIGELVGMTRQSVTKRAEKISKAHALLMEELGDSL